MDEAIRAKSLTDKRFQIAKFAGLCWLTPGRTVEGSAMVFIPAKVTTVGECEFIVPDDNFNIITYHRLLQSSHTREANAFGDRGSNIDAVLTVIGFTSKLRLTADELEALFLAGFPKKVEIPQLTKVFTEPVSSNFDSTSIFNTEFRGEKYFLKPETIMFQIRYRIGTEYNPDCFEICCEPEAPEGGDEEPEGEAEMTLMESEFEIPMEFASTTTTDMFFEDTNEGRDVLTDNAFDVLLASGFKSVYWMGGGFSKVAHPVIGDTDRIGGTGDGWNAINPDCVTVPLPFGGELCQDFRHNGEPVDFFNSHMDLCGLHDMQNIVSANITDGTIEEVYWQIDRTIAVTGQAVIPILFGLESPASLLGGDQVAITTCAWIDLIKAEYPSQPFTFVFDIAALWSPTAGETAYNVALVANLSVPMSEVAIRVYCHGFKLWDDLLNGDPVHDVAAINTAMEQTLPAFTAAIASSAFAECPVYIAQLSSSYFYGEPYNSVVLKGLQYFTAAYPRMVKHFIEQARDGGVNYFGVAPAGVNAWINVPSTLDLKFFSVMNRLIEPDTNALTITYTAEGIDIYGGKRNGNYCLVVQNRGASDYAMPTTMNLNGEVTEVECTFSTGEHCASVSSTTSTNYAPGLTIKPRSINFLTIIKKPT